MGKEVVFYTLLAAAIVSGIYFATQENKDEFELWK